MTIRGGVPRKLNDDGLPVCRRGHVMTPENTYIRPGYPKNPQCRQCRRLKNKKGHDEYTREFDAER